jgi:hypothetical protein
MASDGMYLENLEEFVFDENKIVRGKENEISVTQMSIDICRITLIHGFCVSPERSSSYMQ